MIHARHLEVVSEEGRRTGRFEKSAIPAQRTQPDTAGEPVFDFDGIYFRCPGRIAARPGQHAVIRRGAAPDRAGQTAVFQAYDPSWQVPPILPLQQEAAGELARRRELPELLFKQLISEKLSFEIPLDLRDSRGCERAPPKTRHTGVGKDQRNPTIPGKLLGEIGTVESNREGWPAIQQQRGDALESRYAVGTGADHLGQHGGPRSTQKGLRIIWFLCSISLHGTMVPISRVC